MRKRLSHVRRLSSPAMPPRRSARVAEVAERSSAAAALPLPASAAHAVFRLLSACDRGRCACVSRAWRAAMCDASLWTRLELEKGQGDAVLLGAGLVAAARGGLTHLDLSWDTAQLVSIEAVTRVARANAASLRHLRLMRFNTLPLYVSELMRLLRAAPHLLELHASIHVKSPEADTLLAGGGELAPLRLQELELVFSDSRFDDEAAFASLMARVAAVESVRVLKLACVSLFRVAMSDALVAAAAARRLTKLELFQCFWPASADRCADILVSLLNGCPTLRALSLCGVLDLPPPRLLDGAGCARFAQALLRHAALVDLELRHMQLWDGDAAVGVPLLRALAGRPTLRSLALNDLPYGDAPLARRAAGQALGAFVRANPPALAFLELHKCGLELHDLTPLCAALPHNTRMEFLQLSGHQLTPAFINRHLMPGLRENQSLQYLDILCGGECEHQAAAADAEAYVNARRR